MHLLAVETNKEDANKGYNEAYHKVDLKGFIFKTSIGKYGSKEGGYGYNDTYICGICID